MDYFCVFTFSDVKILFPKLYVSQTQHVILCVIDAFLYPTACEIIIYMIFDVFFFMLCDVSDGVFVKA